MLRFTVEDEPLGKYFSGLSGRMHGSFKSTLALWSSTMKTSFIRDRLSGLPLRARSRNLQRSIQSYATPTEAGVYSDSPYIRIQDLGGAIRPRKSRWLTIPSPSQRTAAGVQRWRSLRELDNVFFKRVGATLFAFQKTPSGRVTKVATLVRGVWIRPKNLTGSFAPRQFDRLVELLNRDIARALP